MRIEGTVTGVRLINPHAEFFVEVINSDGEAERWAIESDSRNELTTLGFTDETVQVGDHWPDLWSSVAIRMRNPSVGESSQATCVLPSSVMIRLASAYPVARPHPCVDSR